MFSVGQYEVFTVLCFGNIVHIILRNKLPGRTKYITISL